MHEVATFDRHAVHVDVDAEIDDVHIGVGGNDRAGQHLEARRDRRNIADRSVGDHPEAAERLMNVRLYLTPERAIADVLAVEVFHHHDTGLRRACDIIEVIQPFLHVAGLPERHRVLRFERYRLGEADDGRKLGKWAMQVLDRVAETAALRRDDLDQVAHRWRIDRLQKIEMGSARRGHEFPPWDWKDRP